MKLATVAGDTVYELSTADLRHSKRCSQVARRARPGDLVYAPVPAPLPAIADRLVTSHLEMHSSRPDANRVSLLRDALSARGKTLRDEGAMFYRVVAARRGGL